MMRFIILFVDNISLSMQVIAKANKLSMEIRRRLKFQLDRVLNCLPTDLQIVLKQA